MADKVILKTITAGPNEATEFAYTSVGASDRAVVDAGFKDEKTLFLFKAAAKSTVTIKHGNGYAGVNDITLVVDADNGYALNIDTAIFKNVSGADKGKVILTGTAAFDLAVVEAKA